MQLNDHTLNLALKALYEGKIVAYPTETFYGLAVDPFNDQAIDLLYRVKRRDRRKALSLLIPTTEYLSSLISFYPRCYDILMEEFWPGPLTLIFSTLNKSTSSICFARKDVAIRISSNPIAKKLCTRWGRAITTTSANISGGMPLNSAEEVENLFGDTISCVIDGGITHGGHGSTIIRCNDSKKECYLIREGAIRSEEIAAMLPCNYSICKG